MMTCMTSHPDLARPRPSGPAGGSGEAADAQVSDRSRSRGGASRRTGAAARRQARQREIVAATRALFDAREMRDANIDDIARAVGVNRAIIYRHFASKDELFALTLAEYLEELQGRLEAADRGGPSAPERLADLAGAYADFCLEYPAFLDCALTLLRQPRADLLSEVSAAVMTLLGQRLVSCLSMIAQVLRDGTAAGDFAVEDVDLTANMIYLQTLGSLHLARTGFIVGDAGAGITEVRSVDEHQFRSLVIRAVLAAARH
jgi:AcrR family transcriptional regulator